MNYPVWECLTMSCWCNNNYQCDSCKLDAEYQKGFFDWWVKAHRKILRDMLWSLLRIVFLWVLIYIYLF